jgi:hypothetical protein
MNSFRNLRLMAILVLASSMLASAAQINLSSNSQTGNTATSSAGVGGFAGGLGQMTPTFSITGNAFANVGNVTFVPGISGSLITGSTATPTGWGTSTAANSGFVNVAAGQVGQSTSVQTGVGLTGAQSNGSVNFTEFLTFTNNTGQNQVVGFNFFGNGFISQNSAGTTGNTWSIANTFGIDGMTVALTASGTAQTNGSTLSALNVLSNGNSYNYSGPVTSANLAFLPGGPDVMLVIDSGAPGGLGQLSWRVMIPWTFAPGMTTVGILSALALEAVAGDFLGDGTGSNISMNYSNTAGVRSIDTPNGVTWSSESGVFLNQVPEPGTLALLAAPVALLLYRRTKKS